MNPTLLNPSDYKLLAFDIDGTLVGSSKLISPFTKKILSRLRAKGILSTLATGRILPAVKNFADELEIDIPLILSNGSILQTRQGVLAGKTCLPLDVIQTTIQTCRSEGRDLVLYICDSIYVEQINDNIFPVYGSINKGLFQIGRWENISDKLSSINKCVIVDTTNEQNLISMQPILRQALHERADTLRTSPVLLEVQPMGVTKAAGLRQLADLLTIRLEEMIAFGDYDNDAEMLRDAGLGIAVGNATEACLLNADLLIPSAEEDGPAHFLEDLFFGAI
jgi:Cof subfamily protein (haloacid dehalogenase superfamily)